MRALFVSLFALLALALVVLPGVVALAQSGGGYDLAWNTIDGGGITWGAGGDYILGSTIGQPDAAVLSGGDYALVGGFWGGAMPVYGVYLPLILRGAP